MPPGQGRRAAAAPLAGLLAALLLALAGWIVLGGNEGDEGSGSTVSGSTASSSTGSSNAGSSTAGLSGSPSGGAQTPVSGLPTIAESALPVEAHETLRLIRAGGPYPYDQDDETFGNRERLLPDQPGGYYREYTVETPGEDDRGARRIVTGADGDRYFTRDHYGSFEQIQEGT